MSAYYMNEATFDLPVGFVDRTTTFLEATTEQGGGVVLLVERHPLEAGQNLARAVAKRLTEARKEVRGFTIISEEETSVSDAPAIDVATRWRDDDEITYTRSIHWVSGSTMLIVAAESSFQEREICDHVLQHVIGSIRPIH